MRLTNSCKSLTYSSDIGPLADSVFPEAPEDKEEDVSLELFSSSKCFF